VDYSFCFFPAIPNLGTFGNNWKKSLFQTLDCTSVGVWNRMRIQVQRGFDWENVDKPAAITKTPSSKKEGLVTFWEPSQEWPSSLLSARANIAVVQPLLLTTRGRSVFSSW